MGVGVPPAVVLAEQLHVLVIKRYRRAIYDELILVGYCGQCLIWSMLLASSQLRAPHTCDTVLRTLWGSVSSELLKLDRYKDS